MVAYMFKTSTNMEAKVQFARDVLNRRGWSYIYGVAHIESAYLVTNHVFNFFYACPYIAAILNLSRSENYKA